MRAKRTIYHVGGGGIIASDEIDVEWVILHGSIYDGKETMVDCAENEIIMPGDVTCIYKRNDRGDFVFDRYRTM